MFYGEHKGTKIYLRSNTENKDVEMLYFSPSYHRNIETYHSMSWHYDEDRELVSLFVASFFEKGYESVLLYFTEEEVDLIIESLVEYKKSRREKSC